MRVSDDYKMITFFILGGTKLDIIEHVDNSLIKCGPYFLPPFNKSTRNCFDYFSQTTIQ